MPGTTRCAARLLMLAILGQLSGCGAGSGLEQTEAALDRLTHVKHEHPMDHFVIVWRFVEYGDSEPVMEYVGSPELEEANNPSIPPATAQPMIVDCSRYTDFGVMVRRTRLYHRASLHKVDFRLVDEKGNAPQQKTHTRQRRAGLYKLPDQHARTVTSRYIKGLARLIGSHEDGVYRVQVTHLDDTLGEAMFELTNCEDRS